MNMFFHACIPHNRSLTLCCISLVGCKVINFSKVAVIHINYLLIPDHC